VSHTDASNCHTWTANLEIAAANAIECSFLLGEADSKQEAAQIHRRFQRAHELNKAAEAVCEFWKFKLSAVQIETPCRALDILVNGWLPYQNLSCRLWGRSAFYQSGGAFGFRDQLQDAAAFVLHHPDITRRQILLHSAHQFVEGDVLHWWHPPQSRGLRTRFSDDLLWLPYVATHYVRTTGDEVLWDKSARFLTARRLHEDEAEALVDPEDSGTSASVYEHCCRAIDISLATGAHGLPLMGCGDWNDGMNRIGWPGRGESVWMGFFLVSVLEGMLPVCERRGDQQRADQYRAHRANLVAALNEDGWDGAWYRRAFYDDGTPVGSAANVECRIDALVQAWSVLSKVAPPERAALALQSVEDILVDEKAGLIRLLTPPFDKTPRDPGYIKGYLPGIRENGGQYTHGVLWFIRALVEVGRGSRAVELLEMLLPINHARTPEEVAIYQVEPYVVAADVYGEPPHVGRGGWTWYTGSAGWMWRVAVESILGLGVENGKTLVLNPCISARWPMCKLQFRLPDGKTEYNIVIENPVGKQSGITSVTVDGTLTSSSIHHGIARLPLISDGGTHNVVVRL
jgi:cyclic beta-1,2-glucan synthetase